MNWLSEKYFRLLPELGQGRSAPDDKEITTLVQAPTNIFFKKVHDVLENNLYNSFNMICVELTTKKKILKQVYSYYSTTLNITTLSDKELKEQET